MICTLCIYFIILYRVLLFPPRLDGVLVDFKRFLYIFYIIASVSTWILAFPSIVGDTGAISLVPVGGLLPNFLC